MLDVLGVKDAQKLIPMDEDQKPTDPVTENQNILMQKPVKAFAYQDHQAHITVHMNAMQDPKILSILGQSPQAQNLQAAMQAHINEHLGFAYRVEIEKQLGMNLPPMTDEAGEPEHMDPEVEARLAPLLAQASQQLLMQNQQQAAQQQAMQQAQDPMVQMQQQELALKQAELQRKQQKDQADIMLKQQSQQIEAARVAAQTTQANRSLNINTMEKMAATKARRQDTMLQAGVELHKDLNRRMHDDKVREEDLAKDLVGTLKEVARKPTKKGE